MKWFLHGKELAEEVVFAHRMDAPLDKRIDAVRALRKRKVEQFLTSADNNTREAFFQDFMQLNDLLKQYATVSERLLLFIDNSVLTDVRGRENSARPVRVQRYYSLLAILAVAEEQYDLDLFGCVTPAVLYETSDRGRDVRDVEMNVKWTVAELGLSCGFYGYSGVGALRGDFKKIAADEREILGALKQIRDATWKRQFKTPIGQTIPFAQAEAECPNCRVQYFNAWYLKLALMQIIHKRMFESNKQANARIMMRSMSANETPTILKPNRKGDGVEGLGDIELLSYCDLATQTRTRSPEIVMGLTVDRDLHQIMRERARVMGGMSIDPGTDDRDEAVARWQFFEIQGRRRLDLANRRAARYDQELVAYLETIKRLFEPDRNE